MSIQEQFNKIDVKDYTGGWATNRVTHSIPNWDEYFMSIAMVVATRSKDSQTKYGCVLTKDNKIIGTGYNSFLKGMPDHQLPNIRPEKYPWMRHAERNALDNTTVKPNGATCYIGGYPCWNCLNDLASVDITDIVVLDSTAQMLKDYSSEEKARYLYVVQEKNIQFREVSVNESTLQSACEILKARSGV